MRQRSENRAPGRAYASPACDGFTLIELMVVLILITLLSTMVVPSAVSAMRRNTIRTEGDKLMEMLRFAYVTAIARHHPVEVNLDVQRGRCWVSLSSTALPWAEEAQETRTETLSAITLPEDLRLNVTPTEEETAFKPESPGWEVIRFQSDGRANGARVTLADPKGETFAIEVSSATGAIVERANDAQ